MARKQTTRTNQNGFTGEEIKVAGITYHVALDNDMRPRVWGDSPMANAMVRGLQGDLRVTLIDAYHVNGLPFPAGQFLSRMQGWKMRGLLLGTMPVKQSDGTVKLAKDMAGIEIPAAVHDAVRTVSIKRLDGIGAIASHWPPAKQYGSQPIAAERKNGPVVVIPAGPATAKAASMPAIQTRPTVKTDTVTLKNGAVRPVGPVAGTFVAPNGTVRSVKTGLVVTKPAAQPTVAVKPTVAPTIEASGQTTDDDFFAGMDVRPTASPAVDVAALVKQNAELMARIERMEAAQSAVKVALSALFS